MGLKTIDQNPKITDTILLEIDTPDANGCYISNPYKVDNVTIYMVERDFMGQNFGEYDQIYDSADLLEAVAIATQYACNNPDDVDAVRRAQEAINTLESARKTTTYYYKDRKIVHKVGTSDFPAWIGTDLPNSALTNVSIGHYTYEWTPDGTSREGDYFACWTWTPLAAGESLSAHIAFKIDGDSKAVISIPTHVTAPDKYETLLERYLPEMYKSTLSDRDITPQALDLFNQSVALGFTFLEDMANQIIDLYDANAIHESLLMFLANTFNIRLKSGDPTLWRRQVKEAIPLFKKKGTLSGLQDAFAQSGMTLDNFTQFWQIVSPYTWEESFLVKDSHVFALQKDNVILPIDAQNFKLWIRREGETDYTLVSNDCVSIEMGDDMIWRITWVGDQLLSPVAIYENDIIRIRYQYNNVPGSTEQTLENYIQSLPLGDLRDEVDQNYPPKNWNVKIIAEDDPLFNLLVPVRHPYHDWVVFGQVRTEFAYSENIYNMDEYNGSLRPSIDPCHIDKSFTDPCGACLSSFYSIDVSVQELNNDRLREVQDIIEEYVPFNAQLYAMNFSGEINEFVPPPVEELDILILYDHSETVLSGQANPFFIRTMEGGLSNWVINREDLADKQTVLSGKTGTAYNDYVAIVSVNNRIGDLGVIEQFNVLEVLSPSLNAGIYKITKIDGHIAQVSLNVPEPLDESAFTFNLSNVIYSNWFTSISQGNLVGFADSDKDFSFLDVKSEWDVEHTTGYDGGAWKVLIPAYSATAYTILEVQNGILILSDHDNSLPTDDCTGITYTLLNDSDETVTTGTGGEIAIEHRGYVNLNDAGIVNIHDFVKAGDYLYYNNHEYEVGDFDNNNFWINDWTDGSVSGIEIQIRRRLLTNAIGIFGYSGLNLITSTFDHESEFGIINGTNPPIDQTDDSHCKENYMFNIGGNFYKILEWDKNYVRLAGREQNWTTINFGGTEVPYSIVWFPTKQVNVQFLVFDNLDRDGHDVVVREIYDQITDNTAIVALSNDPGTIISESVSQDEGVSYIIERRNGTKDRGEL